ncbi:MAG TPA: hypothetical protein VLF19_01145 [Methylomirabilota bacterium]|nr:hypothetical protein [Methylomirabilota bacterium]
MEQILLLALFVVGALASQLARWLKARRPAEAEPAEGVEALPPRARPRQVTPVPVETSPLPDVRLLAPAPPSPPRRPPRSRLGRPSDLRGAIVLMAVLGPCRALEHEEPPLPR